MAMIHVHRLNFTYSDIALMKLEKKLDYSQGIMPICLPEEVDYRNFIDQNTEVYISGYNFHFHRKVPFTERYCFLSLMK